MKVDLNITQTTTGREGKITLTAKDLDEFDILKETLIDPLRKDNKPDYTVFVSVRDPDFLEDDLK